MDELFVVLIDEKYLFATVESQEEGDKMVAKLAGNYRGMEYTFRCVRYIPSPLEVTVNTADTAELPVYTDS